MSKTVYLVASGDLRPGANRKCWPVQAAMEKDLCEAVKAVGWEVVRAHPYNAAAGHGFIASQREGLEIFRTIPTEAPVIVAESVWQYSHHVYPGLLQHHGNILTVANWDGTWPGLVGVLNLNACLTKAGRKYASLWSESFADQGFREKLRTWLQTGDVEQDTSHVCAFEEMEVPEESRKLGEKLAAKFRESRPILGIFDEGCMGMYNAMIEDDLLFPLGVYKERLSQSVLFYETNQVSDTEAEKVYRWMVERGMTFHLGEDDATELTEKQVLLQCKMYIAAVRLADDFGCQAIGIQYQQGLKDLLPASDLVEGMLNNAERPPVKSRDGERILFPGEPLPHFNEVDECAGLDALLIQHVHRALGQPVETTLHDVRWGAFDPTGSTDAFVWVFLISGAVPPAHFGGWNQAHGMRQDPMYFPFGGSTLQGVSRPGEIVWSRIFVADGKLQMDLGRGASVALPEAETQRRLALTTPVWPIMNAELYGVSRDQFMARHKANHIQVVYANSAAEADDALWTRAAMAQALGIQVQICGWKN
ncbi:MAG: fucose isomerase [Planctomycetia bacterium]|nr:fucose isomerase [Planctomycetia bacterium]